LGDVVIRRLLLVLLALLGLAGVARAHPHVFTDARTELVVDAEGRLTGVRHAWTFDEVYSAFAAQGFDANRDGTLSREELQPLADINVTSVAEFGYFTWVLVDGRPIRFGEPTGQYLTHDKDSGQLTLHFLLPLAEAVDARANRVLVKVYDPEYFVAFDLEEDNPVTLAAGAPAACRFEIRRPQELDETVMLELSRIPASVRALPTELRGVTSALANDIGLDCSGSRAPILAAMLPAALLQPPAPPRSGSLADIARAQDAADAVARPIAPDRPAPGFFASFLAQVALTQAQIYRTFGDAIRAVADDPWALFALLGLAFGYGVLHAAGPGHGKVVIASYLLATRETLARGVLISFVSALAQGVVAIAIVGVFALALQATSAVMTRVAGIAEIASYGIVALVGAWLLARKLMAFLPAPRPAASLSAAAAAPAPHVHGPDCGHVHAPDPRLLSGPFDLKTAAAATLAVGLRPCTGALLVLVFAMAQGVFGAGLAAVLAMSLGTGATVAALATIAVLFKGLAVRLAARRERWQVALSQGIEVLGALVVLLFGVVLFTAALIYGPFGG
jgi:ABC-type nickel/cobalt efflux system permease component RcnA/ABC-type uncharacterized transport system substrate-binding protein